MTHRSRPPGKPKEPAQQPQPELMKELDRLLPSDVAEETAALRLRYGDLKSFAKSLLEETAKTRQEETT